MFELGRDLKRLFDQARESDDLGWLELIGPVLLAGEARACSIDAGRVSCARPVPAWLRASAVWREHAARTGDPVSLERAASAARDALAEAEAAARPDPAGRALAHVAAAETDLLAFDLYAGTERLDAAALALTRAAPDARALPRVRAVHALSGARLALRLARSDPATGAFRAALDQADQALAGAEVMSPGLRDPLRLDTAAVRLERGLIEGEAAMLDAAGRDLAALAVEAAPDQRPLTRARALTLSAAGLTVLAAVADDAATGERARALFEAAVESFTPDHGPLDRAAVEVARGDQATLADLIAAEGRLTHPGLIVAALIRDRRIEVEARLAAEAGDVQGLERLRRGVLAGLAGRRAPADWAMDQLALARIGVALKRGGGAAHASADGPPLGLILTEAEATLTDLGAAILVERLRQARRALQV